MSKALTDRQQELCDKNQSLVYYLARKYAKDAREYERYVDAGFDGLFAASRTFRPDRGVHFLTWAYKHVKGRMFDTNRRSVRCPNKDAQEQSWRLSLDAPAAIDTTSNLPVTFMETIEDPATKNAFEEADFWTRLASAAKVLTEKQRDVLYRWLAGYTQRDLAESEGVSTASINERLRSMGYRLQDSDLNETGERIFCVPKFLSGSTSFNQR